MELLFVADPHGHTV